MIDEPPPPFLNKKKKIKDKKQFTSTNTVYAVQKIAINYIFNGIAIFLSHIFAPVGRKNIAYTETLAEIILKSSAKTMNQVHPAVKAIIQRGEKFLVIKQEFADNIVWDLPGGKVDFGESPYNTLMREVNEEIHLSINIIRPLGFFWFFRHDGDQVVCTTFLCTADGEIDLTKNPADENITEYRWVTKDEFISDEYTVSHDSMKKLFALL